MLQVGCAGILVVDTIGGPVKALPDPGQLVIFDDIPSTAGGCAANVACSLAKQGVAAGVAGRVGEDSAAELLRGELRRRIHRRGDWKVNFGNTAGSGATAARS